MYLLLFSGFHGTHCPPAPLSQGIEDNMQEAHDVADFDIPDTQEVLERFMSAILLCRAVLAMMNREDLHLRNLVRFHFNGYVYEILSICCVYTIHILTKIF
jgi:hypothetical protein